MVGHSLIQVPTCPTMLPSSFISVACSSSNFLPCLPPRPQKKPVRVKAMSTDAGHGLLPSASQKKGPLAAVLEVPQTLWKQTLKPLMDFGFDRRSVWEGGVGLFLVSGAVLAALCLAWLRGFQLRSKFRKYLAVIEFSQAWGICTGTPVRIRGVCVGSVIRVDPSLKNIEALVEVEDDKIIIPINSLIEVNQSGLLMETVIDITPREPIPMPFAGPLDAECVEEGVIICDRQKMKGYEGVSLDALVRIFTRLGHEVEEIGIANSYTLAQRIAAVIEDSKPLLTKIQAMAEDVQPLLSEVRDSGLLKDFETLTGTLAQASEDFRTKHATVMNAENTELIRKSIYSLIVTLKNIENITTDVVGFTGDEATKRTLKALIKSLSRLL